MPDLLTDADVAQRAHDLSYQTSKSVDCWIARGGEDKVVDAYAAEFAALLADRDALLAENGRLRERMADLQMLAFKWMERHDRIAAGKEGGPFPSPVDLPDALARAETAERERDELCEDVQKLRVDHAMVDLGVRLKQLYEIREALGWNDKTSLDILARGVRDVRKALATWDTPTNMTLVDLAAAIKSRISDLEQANEANKQRIEELLDTESAEARLAALDRAGRPVEEVARETVDRDWGMLPADVEEVRRRVASALTAERLAAGQREERLRKALERIEALDEAMGHELTWGHASEAVAIASAALSEPPKEDNNVG